MFTAILLLSSSPPAPTFLALAPNLYVRHFRYGQNTHLFAEIVALLLLLFHIVLSINVTSATVCLGKNETEMYFVIYPIKCFTSFAR